MSDALSKLASWVRDARAVVYVAGAGLSVASGIRPYRNAPDAIWARYVTDWGTTQKFREDPAAWWATFWLEGHGDLFKAGIAPNEGHRALAALCERSLLVTQNIDGLSRVAGHSEEQLIEIHGRHDRFVCADGCEGVLEQADLSRVREGMYPKCAACGGPIRPLVLLFDELYDSHDAYQARRARRALNDAELIVFVGTSFSVGITDYALRCADASRSRVASVNLEGPPQGRVNVLDVHGPAEEVLPRLVQAVGSKVGLAGRFD